MDQSTKLLTILRVFLFCAGFGWFISIFGVFMPWSFIVEQLEGLGAKELPSDPMLNYWLRMTAGAFTFIGIFFFILAAKPVKYSAFIPFTAGFLIAEGLILFSSFLILRLPFLPSVFDSVFCLLIGAGVYLSYSALKGQSEEQKE